MKIKQINEGKREKLSYNTKTKKRVLFPKIIVEIE